VLRFEELSKNVIGAALAVHRELGPGFLESVYHSAMRVSLTHRAIPFDSQLPIDIAFEGVPVGRARIDLSSCGSAAPRAATELQFSYIDDQACNRRLILID
jgi:hypothetical protein